MKNPIFEEEEVFLKVLVEGKAKLYSYESKSLKRYFYSIDTSKVEQLVFKKYWVSSGKIGTNNKFKQQLWNSVKCENDKIKEFESIGYKKSDLVKRFLKYNECNIGEAVVFEKQKKDFFNLTLRSGINNSSLSISNSLDDRLSSDFGSKLGFRLGVEAEFIMPFNKNKWAIIVEPTYQYFKSEKENTERVFKVDYKTIELPFGIRHYLFLNDDSKVFVNGSYVLGFSYDSTISDNLGSEIDITSGNNVAFGVGYKYDNKYSVEFKYQTNRTILRNYLFWDSKYNGLSVILGYTIF
ncbi:outer membrane beta-barrel protein [Aquimarina sp. I32.4]|uniref:outer membrane beta-barrel protein n=1 Tax=Aquimarina sp. I32.4 TaxID=2053903 RepID=UPI0018ECE5A4|nr:outer membrane beta-barrel protein [Aquimarina sp. I32.4]